MCLIALSWLAHPRQRLVLAANRDEFHARPALPARAHADAPGVFGGRDVEKGGSWLLASASGRFAAVTNVRDGRSPESATRSRGELVDAWVKRQDIGLDGFLETLARDADQYGRYNLLLGESGRLVYAGNHPRFRAHDIEPGLHMLSNGELDAPWPKALRLRAALAGSLDQARVDPESLFEALRDTRQAPDADLPDTGVGLELERLLSAPFILGERYGTRASTVLLVGEDGIELHERSHAPMGEPLGSVSLAIA